MNERQKWIAELMIKFNSQDSIIINNLIGKDFADDGFMVVETRLVPQITQAEINDIVAWQDRQEEHDNNLYDINHGFN